MSTREVRLHDRIKELSHDPAAGAFVFAGAPNGFSPFSDFYESGNVLYYAATDGIRYEVGSGVYINDGSSRTLRRYPLRNNRIDSGPWYVNSASASGPTRGQEGVFHPLYLTDAAASGLRGYTTTKPTAVSLFTFSGHPGVTFHMPNSHSGVADAAVHAATSGANYAGSGAPVTFVGVTEVYVTYPGKYSVFSAFGTSGCQEPRQGGLAVWGSEQVVDYDENIVWDFEREALGISLPISGRGPVYAIDVGGSRDYSQIRASGFIGGGSGVYFSGGRPLPQDATKTASGGTQLEPFYRNELDDGSGADAVFLLTGRVEQRLNLKTQSEATVWAGPPSGSCGGTCADTYPTFRYLSLNDIPDLSTLYVKEETDESASSYIAGSMPFLKESGVIEYDKDFVFLNAYKRLGVNTKSPNATLDVFGDIRVSGNAVVSGNLDVRGALTYIDSTTLAIQDHQLELGSLSGNAAYDKVDSAVDDGGIVVKSSGDPEVNNFDTGDKKWTWRRSTNTWTAQTANGDLGNPLLGINTSGLIFGDQSVISGAYQAGSGLELHNGLELNVGKLFTMSGMNYDANVCHTSGQIHPADSIMISGSYGLYPTVSSIFHLGHAGKPAPSAVIILDPTELSGTLYGSIVNGAYSHWTIGDGSSSENVTNTTAITFTDQGGVDVSYSTSTNALLTSTTALSGWIRETIINSGVRVSGQANSRMSIESGHLQTQLGSFAGGYASWTALGLNGPAGFMAQDIGTADRVTFSGIAGTTTKLISHSANSGELQIDSTPLSGTLYNTILWSGDKVVQQIQSNTLAGSGISKELTGDGYTFNFDTNGSGYLTQLMFREPHRSIRIGAEAGGSGLRSDTYGDAGMGPETIAIGTHAGYHAEYCSGTIFMGSGAGKLASGITDSVIIGKHAGLSASGLTGTSHLVLIGTRAGTSLNLDTSSLVAIGRDAAYASSGCNSSVMVGHNAGLNSFNVRQTVAIGPDAGLQASGSDYSVMVGNQAGESTLVSDQSVFIGHRAGHTASGVDDSVIIGERAGLALSGAFPTSPAHGPKIANVVAIGSQAAYQATDIEESVALGHYAGYQTHSHDVQNGRLNLIGLSVGRLASGIQYINAMGSNAAEELRDSEYVNAFGNYSANDASGLNRTIVMGQQAGRQSQTITYGNLIGVQAGMTATGCSNVNAVGLGAMLLATGLSHCDAMGTYAGAASSGNSYTSSIGYSSSYYSHQTSNNVHLGRKAGYNTSLGDNNIYIGYEAGEARMGSNAIVLGNFNDGNKNTDWAPLYEDGVTAIGTLICGLDQGTAVRKLRLGKEPSNTSDFSNICTSIQPGVASDVVLKLLPANASQDKPYLQTKTRDIGNDNFIINKYGFLRLPIATSWDGSDYKDAAGNVIEGSEGTLIVAATGGTPKLAFHFINWYEV